jgi:DNA-binding beta-propeller fold protein YncE
MGDFKSEEFCSTARGHTSMEISIPRFRYEQSDSMFLHFRFGTLVSQNSPILVSQPQIAQNFNELFRSKQIQSLHVAKQQNIVLGISLVRSKIILFNTTESGKIDLYVTKYDLSECRMSVIENDFAVNPSFETPSFLVWSRKGVLILDEECGVIRSLPGPFNSSSLKLGVCVTRDNFVVISQGRFLVGFNLLSGICYSKTETQGDCEFVSSVDSRVVVIEKLASGMFVSVYDSSSLYCLSRSPLATSEPVSLYSFCHFSGLLYAFSQNVHIGCFTVDGKKVTPSIGWRTESTVIGTIQSVLIAGKQVFAVLSSENTCSLVLLDSSRLVGSEMRLVSTWSLQGMKANRLRAVGPNGIAILGNEVFVASLGGAAMQVFNKNGKFIRKFERDSKMDEDYLPGPNFILTCQEPNLVLVSEDCNQYHRILVFRSDGNRIIQRLSSKGSDAGQLHGPQGMVLVGDELFVAEELNDRISVFSMDRNGKNNIFFKFSRVWGSRGNGEGQLNGPKGLAASLEGLIYVADARNHRIQVFETNGTFVRSFGSDQLKKPFGVAISDGRVLVSDVERCEIQIFSLLGTFISKWGSAGNGDGLFRSPTQLCCSDGCVYVCDLENLRVQVFE